MNCCKEDSTVNKKIIAVVGATGQQGGGLVQAILDDKNGDFAVRALTRDPTKENAVALKKAGAEVVKFDMDDASTHAAAFQGCYGAFVVTNYWESMSADKEKAQAKGLADACKAADVKHIVWSTLEGTVEFFNGLAERERPNMLEGGYVPHFDSKHECNALFPSEITTNLYTSFYLENFINFGMVKDGVFCNNMGDGLLPVIGAADIGKCAYGIFKAGDEYKGKDVYIACDVMTCTELMKLTSQVTGKEFTYQPVVRETYSAFDFPGANDMANMFYYKVKCDDFNKKRDPATAKKLNPDLMSTKDWLEANKDDVSKLAKN